MADQKATIQDFSGYSPTWCPGCGDWGIGIAVKSALSQLGYSPSSVFVSFDIGCSGNMNDFLNAYAMHGLHGRAVPTAIGMKLGNHSMVTVVIGGDGGLYGEGGNHFIHACRGNHDITIIVHDNGVYGLTTGQVAPTAKKGYKSKTTPSGIVEEKIDQLSLAITQGATFVAQSFAGNVPHVIQMIKAGIQHRGLSLVNILQPCVTFNKANTYQYYRERVYKLDESHDKTDMKHALDICLDTKEGSFPLGIIYQIDKPTYHDTITRLDQDTPLVQQERWTDYEQITATFI